MEKREAIASFFSSNIFVILCVMCNNTPTLLNQ